MREERTIETYQNLLMEVSEDLWKCREERNKYKLALARACYYLTRGFYDNTEKKDFTAMQWEEFLIDEVKDAD